MEILITSDLHGETLKLEKLKAQYPNITTHLDAGDSNLSITELNKYNVTSVRGNMDSDLNLNIHEILTIDNKKILLIHGHTVGVKSGLLSLYETAVSIEANIVIFGHTHEPYMKRVDNILFINPGSLRYGNTYVIYKNDEARFYFLWQVKLKL